MTTDEYIAKMRRKLALLKEGKALAIAAQDTHVMMSERIFTGHDNANNGSIGEYDNSTPIYVNPANSPRKFPTKGKTGQSKFKNGKPHKTGYFDSYKAFRDKIGRQTSEVDLKLFGRLQSDFSKGLVQKSLLLYTAGVNGDNADKISGLEKKFGKIFKLTKQEKANFQKVLHFESMKILK